MFIASGPELVIAQCKAGVIGSFPALNARPASVLNDVADRIEERARRTPPSTPTVRVAPFAVNQIVHRSNDRLEEDMEVVVEHQVPIVITSLGARTDINDAVHSYGGIVLHDVINDRFARKAIEKGADGLIAVAAGAGGHAGTQSPFALVQEIRSWFDGPLLLSGAIAHGRSVLAAQAAGADLAYVGSAFLATTEANNQAEYKQMIVDSTAVRHRLQQPVHRRARQLPARQHRRPPGSTPTTCRSPTPARWTSARAAPATPRRGRTSGAPDRASAPSRTSSRPPSWSRSSTSRVRAGEGAPGPLRASRTAPEATLRARSAQLQAQNTLHDACMSRRAASVEAVPYRHDNDQPPGEVVNKNELIAHVADKTGSSKTDASAALDAMLDGIADQLADGNQVVISGFGTFETRERAARTGRNPQTGESIDIAASTSAAFKPAAALKRRVAGN